jgi:hypothetical protein
MRPRYVRRALGAGFAADCLRVGRHDRHNTMPFTAYAETTEGAFQAAWSKRHTLVIAVLPAGVRDLPKSCHRVFIAVAERTLPQQVHGRSPDRHPVRPRGGRTLCAALCLKFERTVKAAIPRRRARVRTMTPGSRRVRRYWISNGPEPRCRQKSVEVAREYAKPAVWFLVSLATPASWTSHVIAGPATVCCQGVSVASLSLTTALTQMPWLTAAFTPDCNF